MFRYPEAVVEPHLVHLDLCAPGDPDQNPAEPDGIEQLRFSPRPMVVVLINPESALELREQLGVAVLRSIAGPRLCVQNPRGPAADALRAGQAETERVWNLTDGPPIAGASLFGLADS